MAKKPLPSPELLRQLLRYEPETGRLFWRMRPIDMFKESAISQSQSASLWNRKYSNHETFLVKDTDGYYIGGIFNKTYRKARVIWALFYGEWPQKYIDHINGDRSDDRINNLRDVSPKANSRNKGLTKRNKHGCLGIRQNKYGNWVAYITINKSYKHLGTYPSKDIAIAVRKNAEIEHRFHKNHGSRNATSRAH